jgi:hypothetical protein
MGKPKLSKLKENPVIGISKQLGHFEVFAVDYETEMNANVIIRIFYFLVLFCSCFARPKHMKNKGDYIFCLLWYAQQQNPYNL